MKEYTNEDVDLYRPCIGNTDGEGVDEYYNDSFGEQNLLGEHSLKDDLIRPDTVGGLIRDTTDPAIERGSNNAEEISREDREGATSTHTPTPFDSLKRKAYGFLRKVSGFSESEKDVGLAFSHCMADDKTSRSVRNKQLANVGDYVVIPMPLDDDIGMSVS
ncbi:hypothetical protein FGB62_142g039 [Gracilaria domingensis]|nr:hypothetical protein FGB62_142g039 [Gracilaria domingensis]